MLLYPLISIFSTIGAIYPSSLHYKNDKIEFYYPVCYLHWIGGVNTHKADKKGEVKK